MATEIEEMVRPPRKKDKDKKASNSSHSAKSSEAFKAGKGGKASGCLIKIGPHANLPPSWLASGSMSAVVLLVAVRV